MTEHGPKTPFYNMTGAKQDFNPGKLPDDPALQADGLQKAIDSTLNTINDYKQSGADISELEVHLKKLRESLERSKNRK